MSTTPSKTIAGSLIADVDAQVTVDEKGCLKVDLKIEADNRTSDLIELTENYRLPVGTAYDISAHDKDGPLTTIYGCGNLEVLFRKGTTLPLGEKYWWQISFGTGGYLKPTEEGNIIIGPYLIKPQKAYKAIPISNHRFTRYETFIFALTAEGERQKLVVIETKGNQFEGNLDTEYKRNF